MNERQLRKAFERARKAQHAVDEALRQYSEGIEVTVTISPQNLAVLAYNNVDPKNLEALINQCLEAYLPAPGAYTEPQTIPIKGQR